MKLQVLAIPLESTIIMLSVKCVNVLHYYLCHMRV